MRIILNAIIVLPDEDDFFPSQLDGKGNVADFGEYRVDGFRNELYRFVGLVLEFRTYYLRTDLLELTQWRDVQFYHCCPVYYLVQQKRIY